MKRLFAVLICAALILSCFTATAYAAENHKISSALQTRMDQMTDGDKIEVWFFTDSPADFKRSFELSEYVDHQTRQEILETYGIDEGNRILQMRTAEDSHIFWTAYNRILFELESKNNRAVVEKLGVAEEDIVYLGCSMILNLTKKQILAAAALDEVRGLNYDSSEGPYEPLEPAIYDPGVFDDLIREDKVLYDLKCVLAGSSPDDIIGVYIAFKGPHKTVADMPSWPDKEEAHKEYRAYIEEKNEAYFAEVFNGLDVEIRCAVFGNAVIANVKASDIAKIISYDVVQDIGYAPDDIPDIAESDYIISRIQQQYSNLNVNLFSYEQLMDSLYIVRFTVSDFSTDGTAITSKVGDYILRTDDGMPEAMLLDIAENKICSFSQAYQENLLNDDLLRKLSESDTIKLFKLKRGDADMDNGISVLDATAIQKFKAGMLYCDQISSAAADADADGVVSVLDATRIQKQLAGICEIDSAELLRATAVLDFFPYAIVTASGGHGPYQYCYKIKGGFDAYSSYGEDFGEYSIDLTDQMPGAMNFTTGWIDSNTTTIPVDSLTYGDDFSLIVLVKDSTGTVSEPVSLSFVNLPVEYPIPVDA
ncbi:MAG: hypothetical protein IJH32_06390 [Ruminococcus sp.]|nr:hypothetical protein [Ruminococcus sp.]